jgi:L-lactate dehydrogenase (cytochrome)
MHGADGIFLSNHGGRQLDHAPSSLHTLYELRKHAPGIFEKVEVLVDGGYRRGTDVLKALCLGATAVGLGRPFMYALSGYGTEGVSKAITLLQDEVITGMKLLGARNVRELVPEMVNASLLAKEVHLVYR